MKVGIITIIDNNNYGNRLQNYALQEYIKKLGLESITLKNKVFLNDKIRWCLGRVKHIGYQDNYSKNEKRKQNFLRFNEKINFSNKNVNPWKDITNCDYYIVGSDQVWNPWLGRLRDVELLRFTKQNDKKIAYAASFGVDNLEEKHIRSIKSDLMRFNKISVRENTGKEIVERITGRKDIEVVLDPTLLLEAAEWNNIVESPPYDLPQKYVLCYFLGKKTNNVREAIEKFGRNKNCEIIDVLDAKTIYYTTGPAEFLYLIREAELVCTDSFHAAVFSLIFDKSFVVFERDQEGVVNMNSRIKTLLNNFRLIGREYNGNSITDKNLYHDFSEAYKILEKERKKSKMFLKKAINMF